jgi:hypothetical protein
MAEPLVQVVRRRIMILLPKTDKQFFDKKELYAYVRSFGYTIDDSLLEEFQKQGLMLPPQRHGKGRAKGVPGLWPRQQADLLRSLCMMRDKHKIYQVAPRCNLPVWVWLYWGDEWGITLDQVRRVMKTWAKYQQFPSRERSKQGARELVKEVANRRDGGKQQAIHDLTEILYQRADALQAISDSLYHVFDATQPANGPCDIPVRPETVRWYVELLMEAVNALVNGREIPDVHWQWARCFHLAGLSQYVNEQRRYAHETIGSPVEQMFSVETIESLWSSACKDLAVILGLGLKYPSVPGFPETLRLDVWKKRVKSATVTSKQVISPLILPDGSRSQSLQIMMTATLLNPEEHREEGGLP